VREEEKRLTPQNHPEKFTWWKGRGRWVREPGRRREQSDS